MGAFAAINGLLYGVCCRVAKVLAALPAAVFSPTANLTCNSGAPLCPGQGLEWAGSACPGLCTQLTTFRLAKFFSCPHRVHAEPDGCLKFALSDEYKVTQEMCSDCLYLPRACALCKTLVNILAQHCYAALFCITGQHVCLYQKRTRVLKAP